MRPPPGGDEQRLIHHLNHREKGRGKQNAPVFQAVGQQPVAGAQQPHQRLQKHKAQRAQHRTQYPGGQRSQSQILIGGLRLALAQLAPHNGAGAGAEHDAYPEGQRVQRKHDVDGRKPVAAHKAGHKHPVHRRVQRRYHQHGHRRHREGQQLPEAEFLRNCPFHTTLLDL